MSRTREEAAKVTEEVINPFIVDLAAQSSCPLGEWGACGGGNPGIGSIGS